MFKVDFFVDDKRLGAALLALVGLAHGQPSVVPVVNIVKQGRNGVAAKSDGSTVERFAEALKPMKGKTIIARDVGSMMRPLGLAHASRGYVLKQAVDAGLMKKSGKGSGTKYTVL